MLSLRHGLREVDVVRRADAIVSWLDAREYMTGRELSRLFSEGITGRFVDVSTALTEIALGGLVEQGAITQTDIGSFFAFNLVEQRAVAEIDPLNMELAPRELALMRYLDLRRHEPRTVAELTVSFDGQDDSDPWLTPACLGHLAKNGLIQSIGNPVDAYMLPAGAGP